MRFYLRHLSCLVCGAALGLPLVSSARGEPLATTETPVPEPTRMHSDPFVQNVSKIRPSVLAIGSYDSKDSPSLRYVGTGFVVGDGRLAVTNAHVIKELRDAGRLDKLRVFPPERVDATGQPVEPRMIEGRLARVLLEDNHHDLALLRFEGRALKPLEFAEEEPLQGQSVGVLGYPIGSVLGLVPAVHRGVIAAVVPAVLPLPKGAQLTNELAQAIREPYNLYQLDLIVFPGNSGSPLFDAETGKVHGIINKTLADRTREHLLAKPSGISYAVPSRWIKSLIRQGLSDELHVEIRTP